MKRKIECIYPDETLLTPGVEVFPRIEQKKERTPKKDFNCRKNFKRPTKK